jgi:lysine 2,3-aminomutase
MEEWQRQLQQSLTRPEQLAEALGVEPEEIRRVVKDYPMRITPHMLRLIKEKGDPIWLQVVPDRIEGEDLDAPEDPLHEDPSSPAEGGGLVVHRYPDRVLFMVTNQCPIYCRFCTRKRLVGQPGFLSREDMDKALAYIREHTEIRDVILSGGDPLLLTDEHLDLVLSGLRAVPHVEIIRINTRVPGSLPERITESLCAMLKKYPPLYINLHFNHPDELTPEVKTACDRLAEAGLPLGSQTVLLKGINDDPEVMKRLFQKLLTFRVKPYYLYQADLTRGTNHFRTPVEKGFEILRAVQGHTSGLAVPHYVVDAPGGGGKIPVLPPDLVLDHNEKELVLKNYENRIFRYPEAQPDGRTTAFPILKES